MSKSDYGLLNGPQISKDMSAKRFWNVTSVSEEEGEILLYGDVMSRRPVDWWTGEPEPGLYITPEGFQEDLETVKNKKRITVKLNSCGGDLYTGIAIHNALKALEGEVTVIVEGIAASAASVIMCAGDKVSVYPGTLIMIHGVSAIQRELINITELKKLMESMDAAERAVAAIYETKTGVGVEILREMMTEETWMTGREAVDKGFADQILEGGSIDMSLNSDANILMVNGVSHDVCLFRNVPKNIPSKNVISAQVAEINNKPPDKAGNNEGGKIVMEIEELKQKYPELVQKLEQNAEAAGAGKERARIKEIESIQAAVGDETLIKNAKYGENPCTAQELSFLAMQKHAAAGTLFLAKLGDDLTSSGANDVEAVSVEAIPSSMAAGGTTQDDIAATVNAYKKIKGGLH